MNINPKKTSDGTGRDTYVDRTDDVVQGKDPLGKTWSRKPFKHWDLRAPYEGSLNGGRTMDAALKMRASSHRRGGAGWRGSLHMEDNRRMQESFNYTMRAAQRASSARGQPHFSRISQLNGPTAMMQDLGIDPPSGAPFRTTSPRRGFPTRGPAAAAHLATAARATRRSELGASSYIEPAEVPTTARATRRSEFEYSTYNDAAAEAGMAW